MAAKLKIEKIPSGRGGMDTMKITGFKDKELSELKSMEHGEAREKLIEMLNNRNDGIGTCWVCGNGVYGLWFDNEAAYLNIGSSCD